MIPARILFAVTYVLMLIFGKYRPFIALTSGLVFICTGMLPLEKILPSIDFNVLLMIIGTMGLVALFTESRMPMLLSDLIMERVPNVKWAAVALSLFAGVISAFVDNVATVLMIAPIGLSLCRKLKANPVPFIISIAVSSNLQGAATLVGDTTAIMLGSSLQMSFADFFWYHGRPGMFFMVELGALLSALILLFIFRRENAPVERQGERTKVTDPVPTVLLSLSLVCLIAVSFIPEKPSVTNGAICCALFAVGLVYKLLRTRRLPSLLPTLKEIDFTTIGMLIGLFLMIGGIAEQGVIDAAASLLSRAGGGNAFVLYTLIVWGSVIISAFIDNIPYVATMLPVVAGLSTVLGIDPTPLYFGLLSGATLGGNCTPMGASANIAGIGILRREGYEVKNRDFFRIGIPFTLAAIIPAYILIWVCFGR